MWITKMYDFENKHTLKTSVCNIYHLYGAVSIQFVCLSNKLYDYNKNGNK